MDETAAVNPRCEGALSALAAGCEILILRPAAKEPFAQASPSGYLSSSGDPSFAYRWLADPSELNYGVRVGFPSDLVVIETDGAVAAERLNQLVLELSPADREIFYLAPRVATYQGTHHYFRLPDPSVISVPDCFLRLSDGEIRVKALTGYVVGPGSTHPAGPIYSHDPSSPPLMSRPVLPFELANLLVMVTSAVSTSDDPSHPGTSNSGGGLVSSDRLALFRSPSEFHAKWETLGAPPDLIRMGERDQLFTALAASWAHRVTETQAHEAVDYYFANNLVEQRESDIFLASVAHEKVKRMFRKEARRLEEEDVDLSDPAIVLFYAQYDADAERAIAYEQGREERERRATWDLERFDVDDDTSKGDGHRLAHALDGRVVVLRPPSGKQNESEEYECDSSTHVWRRNNQVLDTFAYNHLSAMIRGELREIANQAQQIGFELDENEVDIADDEELSPETRARMTELAGLRETQTQLSRQLRAAQTVPGVKAATSFARVHPLLSVNESAGEHFDRNPFSLSFPNGLIEDLRATSLLFRPLLPADRVTRVMGYHYDPELKNQHPLWSDSLQIILPDEERREFLLDVLAMSLVGAEKPPLILMLEGGGRNGKSFVTQVIDKVMGSYAGPVSKSIFVNPDPDRHPEYKLGLVGLRLAYNGEELEPTDVLNTGTLKSVSALEQMSARGLYQSSFWFVPQSTLVFYTNSMPNVKLGDTAMRERLCRVKFDQHLPSTLTALGRAPVPDYHRVVLESEGPAIVASLVDRAIRVIQEISTGTFAVPDSVKAATSIMLDQADPLSQFVSDVFESDAENSPGKAQWWPVRVLYDQLYLPYCNRQGHAPYRFAGFGKAFENRHPAPSERRRLDSGSRVMCRYLVLTEEGENLMRASISTSFDEYTELNTL